jgi:hypothetical protein
MPAIVQRADAISLIAHLEQQILADRRFYMTYSDAAVVLNRDPAKDSRHVGQVTSRIDAACFYAKLPFIAMQRVRQTYGETINPRSFQGDLWRPHLPQLIARAEAHVWAPEDFGKIRRSLNGLVDEAAKLLWTHIDEFGEKGVQKALGTVG